MANKYDKIKELKEQMNDISIDLVDEYYNSTAYICDAISQVADDACSIYYNDRIEWLKKDPEAVDYIEQGVEEFGIDSNSFDFWQLITQGQYLQATETLYRDLQDIITLAALYHLPDDATEEAIEEVCNLVPDRIDQNNTFLDIENEIMEQLEWED